MAYQLVLACEENASKVDSLYFTEKCEKGWGSDGEDLHTIGDQAKKRIRLYEHELALKGPANGYLMWKKDGEVWTFSGSSEKPHCAKWNPVKKNFSEGSKSKANVKLAGQIKDRILEGGSLDEMKEDITSYITGGPYQHDATQEPVQEPEPEPENAEDMDSLNEQRQIFEAEKEKFEAEKEKHGLRVAKFVAMKWFFQAKKRKFEAEKKKAIDEAVALAVAAVELKVEVEKEKYDILRRRIREVADSDL